MGVSCVYHWILLVIGSRSVFRMLWYTTVSLKINIVKMYTSTSVCIFFSLRLSCSESITILLSSLKSLAKMPQPFLNLKYRQDHNL